MSDRVAAVLIDPATGEPYTTIPVSVASSSQVAQLLTVQDSGNTNFGTLAAGATWTGTWVDCANSTQIITDFRSDQAGTFTLAFSGDGVTADRSLGPYVLAASTDSPQPLVPIRRYYRASYTNTSSSTANLRIETRLSTAPGIFQTRLQDTVSALSTSTLSRSVIFGQNQNATTYGNVGISERNATRVEIAGPLTTFGEVQVAQPNPRVQIDAVYGILTTDVETFTDGVSGSASAANSLFTTTTGTTIGGYGVIRSRRVVRYRPGQSCRILYTAAFSAPAALGLQLAGGFTSTDGLFFGYKGTTFGVLRRIAGAAAIYRLTITVGAAGAENMTVTLNSVPFVVTSGGALSTAATAQRLASATGYTGWVSVVSPTADGVTVTFIQNTPGVAAGTYSFASSGTAAGTFAQVQAGAANDDTTGFVAQTAWNVDRLDGSNGILNPSGMLLDPSKLNVYYIGYPYLGAGTIKFAVMTPTGEWVTVHQIQYPNSASVTSQRNPAFRLGWIAASLGSTTNLTTSGGSAAGFVLGVRNHFRDPVGVSTLASVTNTEQGLLLIRNSATFASVVNQRQLLPVSLNLTVETANRVVRARVVLNPTITGTISWGYVNQTTSSTEYATPSGVTISGGTPIAFSAAVTNTTLSLQDLDLRMEPGDVLAVALVTASSTATADVSLNWQEE